MNYIYSIAKALPRKNEKIAENAISEFIETLEINEDVKSELRAISPYSYTGIVFPKR